MRVGHNHRCHNALRADRVVDNVEEGIYMEISISISSVLMLDYPVTMKSFGAQTVEEPMIPLSLQFEGELARRANLLENLVKKVGLGRMPWCYYGRRRGC